MRKLSTSNTLTILSDAMLQALDRYLHGKTGTIVLSALCMKMNYTYFVKPDIITEMLITVQLRITTISGPSALSIAPKDVYNTVLDLFRDFGEVHIFATSGGAFDLKVIPIVLVKPLKTFYKQEIDGKPWVDRQFLHPVCR